MIFLFKLCSDGLSYSAVNTARCALSSILTPRNGLNFGQDSNVVRLMKGIFNHRPTKPRYVSTWDPNIVLSFFKRDKSTGLKSLTSRLVMLLALTTVQRCQTLQALDINDMKSTQDSVVLTFNKLLKHDKPGRQRLPLRIETSADSDLCAVRTLK